MLLRFWYVQDAKIGKGTREVCTRQKLVLHSRGISILWINLSYQAEKFSWLLTYRLGFFYPDNKKAPVWGLDRRHFRLTLE